MQKIILLPHPPMGLLPPPDFLLSAAIPARSAEADFIARNFFVHHDTVMRWRRPAPTPAERKRPGSFGSGAPSPLHRCCDLLRFVASYDPMAAGRLAIYPSLYYQALVEETGEGFSDDRACASANAKLLKEATDAINAMSLHGACPETLHEQIELRDKASLMIARTYATMRNRRAA